MTEGEPPPRQILIVEDDDLNIHLLSKICRNLGHEVSVVKDGQLAIDALRDAHAELNLVLLDLMLPKVDGFGVLDSLRAMQGGEQLPVIMVTAVQDESALHRAVDLLVDDFIHKPFRMETMARRIEMALQLGELRRRLGRSMPPLPNVAAEPGA